MNEEMELHEPPYELMVEAIRILARRGRKLREAPHDAMYEGMSRDEIRVAVYGKYKRGELKPSEMTLLERRAWDDEIDRQMAELRRNVLEWRHEVKLLGNAVWNSQHYAYLMDRLEDGIWDKLSEKEQEAFKDFMQSCRWGPAEVAQARAMIDTAEWFSELKRS